MTRNITIIGGGAWGSAIASVLAEQKHSVRILVRRSEVAADIMQGQSPALGLPITPPIIATTDPQEATKDAEAIIMVVPVSATTAMLNVIKSYMGEAIPIAFAAKGFDKETKDIITKAADEICKNPKVILSGPSFADEVALGKPAAIVAASDNENAAKTIAGFFDGTNIRVYTSDDPIGVAAAGAIKNVIAIACGIAHGLKLGDNAKAAIMTRGIAEAARLVEAMGGNKQSLFGLAGVGDIALTTASNHSRNFAFGNAIAEGVEPTGSLAEGQYAADIIASKARELNIDMPITEAVNKIIKKQTNITDAIKAILERPTNQEWT